MIDMYGSEVGVGDTIITFVKEGKGCILKHIKVTKGCDYLSQSLTLLSLNTNMCQQCHITNHQ